MKPIFILFGGYGSPKLLCEYSNTTSMFIPY